MHTSSYVIYRQSAKLGKCYERCIVSSSSFIFHKQRVTFRKCYERCIVYLVSHRVSGVSPFNLLFYNL